MVRKWEEEKASADQKEKKGQFLTENRSCTVYFVCGIPSAVSQIGKFYLIKVTMT